MDFLSCKNSQEWLKGYKSLFNRVLKKLSLYEILVEFAIRIWNVFTLALVIINIIIFIITVIIVDIDRLVLAIFASVRTTTEISARQSSLPALAMIVRTPLLHTFTFHEVDDCLRCWGSVVITGIHAFSSSSHFQPEPSRDNKTGLDAMLLFHTSSWSWTWRTRAWCNAACVGGSWCDLACFLVTTTISMPWVSRYLSWRERADRQAFLLLPGSHWSGCRLCQVVIMLGLYHREPRWKHSNM